jgi:hypothetical protein
MLIMKLLSLLMFWAAAVPILSFTMTPRGRQRGSALGIMPLPPPIHIQQGPVQPVVLSPLQRGIESYTGSLTVSLQERKIPTQEEIATKKRNFNLWFWGGGFVAPFLATIFYFGFKFWEK